MNDALIKDTLQGLMSQLNLPVTDIKMTTELDGLVRVDIVAPEPSRIIGWHGETLNAVQTLLKAIVRTKEQMEKAPFLVLDVDGYRRMQEEKVQRIADQKADFVRRTGSRIALAPMSPYFRRVVHMYVANNPSMQDLVTQSVGEGDYRQIVLQLKVPKAGTRPPKAGEVSEELSPVMAEDDFGNLDV
jgi:spoIIIJ-associated protein